MLVVVDIGLFQETGSIDDRSYSYHTVIIMILGGELFSGDYLFGKNFTLKETERIKHDLSNQGIIRHHHSDRSEESLQVIWKLGSSGVTWVHGDENTEGWLHFDEGFLKSKLGKVLCFSSEQNEKLLGND